VQVTNKGEVAARSGNLSWRLSQLRTKAERDGIEEGVQMRLETTERDDVVLLPQNEKIAKESREIERTQQVKLRSPKRINEDGSKSIAQKSLGLELPYASLPKGKDY